MQAPVPLRAILNRKPKPGQLDAYPLDRTDIKVIYEDSQRRQIALTPKQQEKIRQLVAKNPLAGITLTWNRLTGEVDIQVAKETPK